MFGLSSTKAKPGERWRCRARPHEPDATVTVHRIEGGVAHVSLAGLSMCAPAGGEATLSTVGHTPVGMVKLSRSLVQRLDVGVAVPSSFEEGYAQWQQARGGVFDLELPELIGALESALNDPKDLLDHWVRVLRRERKQELIPFAYRAVLALPSLLFVRNPDDSRRPLLWRYPQQAPCVPIFADAARAAAFARALDLGDAATIEAPTSEAVKWMLGDLAADGVAYASVNAESGLDLPLYFDVLRTLR